jgi:hypothetical protein
VPAEKPALFEAYEPSIMYGAFIARKESLRGTRFLNQPVFLTVEEYQGMHTPLQRDSNMEMMLKKGKELVKIALRQWYAGHLNIPEIRAPRFPKHTMDAPIIIR